MTTALCTTSIPHSNPKSNSTASACARTVKQIMKSQLIIQKQLNEKVEESACPIEPTNRHTYKSKRLVMEKLAGQETKDSHCREKMRKVWLNGSEFKINRIRVFVGIYILDGCLEKLVRVSLQRHILHAEHHSKVDRRPEKRIINDIMRRDYFWAHRGTAVLAKVRSC